MASPVPFGTATLQRHYATDTVVVGHADDLIGVTHEVARTAAADGVLVLDTAGHYRYRHVGYFADPSGWGVLLFRRCT